jgi:arabinan endo-1,5-alpha-L-arabinosidase
MLRCLFLLMLLAAGSAAQTPYFPPDHPRVHDPVIAREGEIYYAFSTGVGVPILSSRDLKNWTRAGRVFEAPPAWAQAAVPGFKDHIWAPDIAFFNGKWHLYYSISTFGKNRSVIGVATNPTLNSASEKYRWTDEGLVAESHPSDNFNAIDPNVAFDASGQLWLSFGSFWSGIKLRRLDVKTGKPRAGDTTLIPLSSRPHDNGIAGAVEGPFIVQRDGFYYLFVSFDFCCRGVNSTYNIRVGRAPRIEGPYLDRDGKAMLNGGGTLLLGTQGTMIAPGHCSIFRDEKAESPRDYLVYHFYDATRSGIPTLRVRPLEWKDGWPQITAQEWP